MGSDAGGGGNENTEAGASARNPNTGQVEPASVEEVQGTHEQEPEVVTNTTTADPAHSEAVDEAYAGEPEPTMAPNGSTQDLERADTSMPAPPSAIRPRRPGASTSPPLHYFQTLPLLSEAKAQQQELPGALTSRSDGKTFSPWDRMDGGGNWVEPWAEPKWRQGVTLPGLAAIIGTIAKAASLLAVTAAISQLKWLWYHPDGKPRRMADLELFDDASRGPWGSLVLMLRLRGRTIVYLGTTIVLALMFFEFAIQQSIGAGVRTSFVASDTATVSRLRDYVGSTGDGDWKALVSDPLGSAASAGLISGTEKPALKPECDTASCRWPTFSSLGICSRCADISEEVARGQSCDAHGENNTPQCTIQLNGLQPYQIGFGYNGNGPGTYCNASAYFIGQIFGFYGFGKDDWAGIWYPIVSFLNFEYMISHVDVDEFRFDLLSASECALYACVKTYNVSVINGTSHQDIISVWYNESMPGESHGSQIAPLYLDPPVTTNNTNLEGPYSLTGKAQMDIMTFIYLKFQGLISVSSSSNLQYTGPDLRLIYAQGNVSKVLNSIALTITDYLHFSPGSEGVSGDESLTTLYIHVRWGYVTFPVVLTVFSLVFLLLTIYLTKRNGVEVWKASQLSLLFHGLEHPPTQDGYPLDELREMDHLASTTRMRLQRDDTAALRFVTSPTTR